MLTALTGWWDRLDPTDVRARLTDINDGIVAVAGMGLGLAGAEVSQPTAIAVVVLSAAVGAMSVLGMQLGEAFAEREAVESIAAQERRLLELSPDDELAELAAAFEAKGVSAPTAYAVAAELSAADALSAQLEIEYGIREFITIRQAVLEGALAGLAFLLGASLPLLITLLVPWDAREGSVVAIAVLSLAITSIVLSRRGLSHMWLTVGRSVFIGLSSLGLAFLLGDWLI